MYYTNRNVTPPENPDVPIWRYMSLSQLIAILDRWALWFSQVARLAAEATVHGDPFEGSHPVAEVAERRSAYFADLPPDHQERSLAMFSEMNRVMARTMYVNCWHVNEHESAAMWRTYLVGGEGVAIRSTFRRLTQSIAGDPHKIFVGQLAYIDYATERLPNESQFAPFFTKRKSFEHERELRALLHAPPDDPGDWKDLPDDRFPAGVHVAVDLDTLVEAMYLAPTSPGWFRDVVESLLDRYKLPKEVRQSGLLEAPLY